MQSPKKCNLLSVEDCTIFHWNQADTISVLAERVQGEQELSPPIGVYSLADFPHQTGFDGATLSK
jgi:hypothetical protein